MSGKEIVSRDVPRRVRSKRSDTQLADITFRSKSTRIRSGLYWDIAIGCLFMVIGIWMISREGPSLFNLYSILFWLLGIISTVVTIGWKVRYRKFQATMINVAGGVPIFKDLSGLLAFGVYMFLGGVAFLFSPVGASLPMIFVSAFIMGVGALLFLCALQARKKQYLQFDPDGLIIGFNLGRAMIPWNSIARIEADEFCENPVLLIWLNRRDLVEIFPASKREYGFAELHGGSPRSDIILFPHAYCVDLPVLGAAIARYATQPEARGELALRKIG